MTLEDLGAKIKPRVDKGTVSRWESAPPGQLTAGVIAAYAEALGRRAAEMYRPPSKGPSLDEMVAGLPEHLQEQAINVISAIAGRKAP